MSEIALLPLSGFLDSIVEPFTCEFGSGYHTGPTALWWTKFAVSLAAASIGPYLLLLIAILANFKSSAAIQLIFCVPFLGWLFALPCTLAVLISAILGRYFLRALTIALPFFLFVGWDTLGPWWDWQDEESRLHDISFADELLNWGFYAGQCIWTSGIKYLVCAIAIRIAIVLTGKLLGQARSAMVSSMVTKDQQPPGLR